MKLNSIANSLHRYTSTFCSAMAMLLATQQASAQFTETAITSEAYTVIESMSLPDLTGDDFTDFGTLYLDSEDDKLRLHIIDGVSLEQDSVIIWNNIYDDPSLYVFPDLNGNNAPEVGMFGLRNDGNNAGKPQMFVRDSSTGQNVRVFNWPANWSEVNTLVLSDMTGDGIPEVAIQGRFKEGNRPQLVIKNGATGAALSTYSYPDLFNSPEFYEHSDVDGDGVPEISTFGRIKRNDKIQVKIASGVDPKDRFKAYNFPDKWSDISWNRLDDMNGDGEDEWGLFGRSKEDGRPQLIVKNGVDPKGALAIYAWAADIQDATFFLIPDMNSDGIDEVAVGGRRSNGRYQFQVKNGANRNSVLANHNLNLKLEELSFHVLPDLTGDGIAEIGFLGENISGEYELVVQEGDTEYGEYRRYTLGSDWSEAPSFISTGDTNGDGFPNILTYGQNATTADIAFVPLNRVNLQPTANAGLDQTVKEQTRVTLSGSGTDTDGSISTYNWVQTSGEIVSLTNASSSTSTFESPDILGGETLIFTLTVTDNDGATAEDSVTITLALDSLISEIIFSDANLSNCLSDSAALNNWQFANEVTELDCDGYNIITLDGIENLTALTDLDLGNNQITDITTVANLTALAKLNIIINDIVDISPIANLTALTSLSLGSNEINDISPVVNLTSLRTLSLSSNEIIDISPLADLTALNTLYLSNNNVIDISPLADLTALGTVFLSGNEITDISTVENLTSVSFLTLGFNDIVDISPLANLTELTFLSASNNGIIDISTVANLSALKTLKLSDNQITDITPLGNLTTLTDLDLDDNQIVDVNSLFNLLSATKIELVGNDGIACLDLDSLETTLGLGVVTRPTNCKVAEDDERLTGVFVDSPVEGLQWVSGNRTGFTDVTGAFKYISGDTVQFYIGDILIGEALGNSVIIPIDLVIGAQDINNATVINIVRFLMTLDDDNDASNGIKILAASSNSASGVSIDFTQSTDDFTDSSNVQALIATLTSETTAGVRSLVSVVDALSHAENSIKNLLAGTYSGTFSGDNSGTWVGTLASSGVISGTATSFEVVGFSGTVNTNGNGATDFKTSGGVSDGTTFSGTFNTDGSASGTWSYFGEESGTWTGSKSI